MNRTELVLVSVKSRVTAKTFGFPRVVLLAVRCRDGARVPSSAWVITKVGGGTVYEYVAPHAWSPPNFPLSEGKANESGRNSTS